MDQYGRMVPPWGEAMNLGYEGRPGLTSASTVQEVNKGCEALAAQLESVHYLVSMTQDLRVGRSIGVASPTRSRSKSVVSDEPQVPEMSGRMQAEVLLAEWQEKIAQEKESLAESIQLLAASVNKV